MRQAILKTDPILTETNPVPWTLRVPCTSCYTEGKVEGELWSN
jgi:hypothetical protein